MNLESPWPEPLFDGEHHPGLIHLVGPEGRRDRMDVAKWHTVSRIDHEVLTRVEGPVLDVGCGPGRHCGELASRGVEVMGLDLSEAAVLNASRRGAPVCRGSVFGPVPRAGEWRSILLLDGNVGIGGDPVRLLSRCRDLLAPAGMVLVETEPPGRKAHRGRVRVEFAGEDRNGSATLPSRWFPWATVPAGQLESVAEAAGFCLREIWGQAGRWFGELRRPGVVDDDSLEVSVA